MGTGGRETASSGGPSQPLRCRLDDQVDRLGSSTSNSIFRFRRLLLDDPSGFDLDGGAAAIISDCLGGTAAPPRGNEVFVGLAATEYPPSTRRHDGCGRR